MTHVYISVAGNIGTGKSTLAASLAVSLGLHLVQEDVENNPYLEKFYLDPHRWAFHLQMYNVGARARAIYDAVEQPRFVVDRSFEEDIVFVQEAHANEIVDSVEYAVYERLYELNRSLIPVPDLLIYLRMNDISQLRNRLISRGRAMESDISTSYLASLQTRYDDWFESIAASKIQLDVEQHDVNELAARAIEAIRLQEAT
jgi:deoxyadenosine/deoxycytidine kinase